MHRTRGTNWQHQAHTSKMTAPWKERCATVASLSWMGRRQQRSDLWVKVNGGLASMSWEVTWQGVKVNSALASTILRTEVTWEWKSLVHLQARSWEVRWLLGESQKCTCKHVLRGEVTCEWKSMVHLQAHLERWVDLWVKVNGHLRARLEGQGDLRVKVCSPLGGHKQGDTGTASTSGHLTSRNSSRGTGGGRSWRVVVKAAVEVRLIIWA